MPVSRRLRLSPAARSDLRDIHRYTARTWSPPQAARYLKMIGAVIDGLLDGRHVGRPVSFHDGVLAILAGTHIVFYRRSDRAIDIIRILHQSMDFDRHL